VNRKTKKKIFVFICIIQGAQANTEENCCSKLSVRGKRKTATFYALQKINQDMTGKSCSMHTGDRKLTENIMCKTQRKRVLLIWWHWWKSINRHIQKQDVWMLTKFNC